MPYVALKGSYLEFSKSNLSNIEKNEFDAIIFAQGLNTSDSILRWDSSTYNEVVEGNLTFCLEALNFLIISNLIKSNSRIVLISSIWGSLSKENKLSYSVSKSALNALVKSLAIDLASSNIAVNAVAPGVVESPMTSRNLQQAQIDKIKNETPGKRLVTPEDIAKTVYFLASDDSKGINGQIITLDNGWSISRYV